ncbi:MAG: hypothetical protein M1830_010319 [Pleopsidium flavum]|nr:MAG: hypothetical protein M1830_010319 [Pleopsidium flavum]
MAKSMKMARSKGAPKRPNVVTRSVRATEKRTFPFLKLPPELRNEVYKLLLHQPRPTVVDASVNQYRKVPHILLLNRQIYKEAVSVLYSLRQFYVDVPYSLEPDITRFLTSIGSTNVGMIRRLEFIVHYCCSQHSAALPIIIKNVARAIPKVRMLEEVSLDLLDELSDDYPTEPTRQSHFDEFVRPLLEPLREFTGLKKLILTGDIPDSYAQSLRTDMEAKE